MAPGLLSKRGWAALLALSPGALVSPHARSELLAEFRVPPSRNGLTGGCSLRSGDLLGLPSRLTPVLAFFIHF